MIIQKKPLIIEFTGTPNSGKTSTIHSLKRILEHDGLSVEIKQEDAEIVPKCIPKKTWNRNVWIALGQLQSLIESANYSGDIVLLDRGYYDALFWADFLKNQGTCTEQQANYLKNIFYSFSNQFLFKPDYLFVIDVSIEEGLRRRYADESGEPPVLSTNAFLDSYKKALDDFCNNADFPFSRIDTTCLNKDEVVNTVLSDIFSNFAL